jgi:hypothetical protein
MSSPESLPIEGVPTPDAASAEGRAVWREATTTVLYVSVILLAELAVLPAGGDESRMKSATPIIRRIGRTGPGT